MARQVGTVAGAVALAREHQPLRDRLRLRWWRELLIIGTFYAVYSFIRNQFGSAAVDWTVAYENARAIIDVERAIGLYHEARIQSWFLGWDGFLRFWNVFYGLFHFAVTALVLIFLYTRDPVAYPRWRTIGLVTTAMALIGFALFPLMPPRLLPDCGLYGACLQGTGFVDTVTDIGGIWSFDSGAGEKLSNQYAAMPSMHFGWAAWSFLALYPRLERPVAKAAIAIYPWLTMFAIIVTANHYWIDALGGAIALGIGWVVGSAIHRDRAVLRR
ncbi:MAG: phosphatase PAP2 family protein [Acidimicrobiales bacterium]